MTTDVLNLPAAAAGKPRSLLLTSAQDIRGYLVSRVGRLFLLAMTCSSVLSVLLIFYFISREAVPFLTNYSLLDFLTSTAWYPQHHDEQFGALAIIAGSVYVTFAALLFAVPVGLLGAVFLSDITSFRIRGVVKPVIELLAAIPSVAYGFFAIRVLAPFLHEQFGFDTGANALNASLILSIMALPTIISVCEDSLSAVGRELREASYGLGATRFETVIKVIIPAGHSGIIAGIVLGMMRAIGETMVVWMASGNATQIPSPWWDLSQSIRTMTATVAGDMGETARGTLHYHSLFAIGVLLLVMTLILNLISEYFLNRAKKTLGKTK